MKLLVKATKILAKVVSNASWIGECTPPLQATMSIVKQGGGKTKAGIQQGEAGVPEEGKKRASGLARAITGEGSEMRKGILFGKASRWFPMAMLRATTSGRKALTATKPARGRRRWFKGASQERGERDKEHQEGDPSNNQPRAKRNVEDPGEETAVLHPKRQSDGGEPREIGIFNGLVGGADPGNGLSPEQRQGSGRRS